MLFESQLPEASLQPPRPGGVPPRAQDDGGGSGSEADDLFVDPPPPPKKKRKREPERRMRLDLIGFQPGAHALVSGATGTGKTHYVVDVLTGDGVHKGTKPRWDAVIVICDNISMGQEAYRRLVKNFKGKGGVKFVDGLPLNTAGSERGTKFVEALRDHKNLGYKTMVIVDDLMTQCETGPGKEFVDRLFTSARHCDADVYQLTQEHTYARRRRLNVGYLVCFATPACVGSLAHICRELRPETKGRDVLRCYREATQGHDGHGCLVVCLKQPNQFMFRNTDMRVAFDLEDPVPVDEEGVPLLGGNLGFD